MPNLLSNTSFGVIRTNPKLTTNVKLLYNGKNLYLESFDANAQLSNAAYKNFKISGNSTYDHDIYRFYNSGLTTPTDIAYDVFEEFSEDTVLSSFGNQYEMMYNMGVRSISSEAYDEDMGLLFPLWLNKNNIPNYFVIFRLNGPISVDYNNANDVNDRNTFSKKILQNVKIIKTFDLTENSLIGSYLRRYVNQKDFPISPIYATWNENEPWEWRGISYNKGGFSKGSNYVYEDLVVKDASLMENEYYITKGFERNKIICANLINIEFLFSDETAEDYTINRYFGLYVNKLDEAQFDIDGEGMFKCPDANQTPRFDEISSKINKNLEDTIIVKNANGVLLSIDETDSSTIRENGEFLTSKEVNDRNSLFYIQDKNGDFHSIKKSDKEIKEWSDNQIRLFEDTVDISLFTGFKKPDTFAKCKVMDMPGVATACIEIIGEIKDYFTIEFEDSSWKYYDWEPEHGENEHSLIFEDIVKDPETDEIRYTVKYNKVFGRKEGETWKIQKITELGEVVYENVCDEYFKEGSNCFQYFCFSGSPENVATAIANAINSLDEDKRFFKAHSVKNKVIIQSKFAGKRMNALRLRIENMDENAIKLHFTESNHSNIAHFIGGTSDSQSMLRIDKNDHYRFEKGKYVKTRSGYAKILGYLPYMEFPEYDDYGNIIEYKGIDEYETVFCDDGFIEIPNNNIIALYEDFKNSLGRFSIFPVKDFDFDIYSDSYKSCYDILEEIEYYTTSNIYNNDLNEHPDIIDFYVHGFSKLKDINFTNFEGNEYDRLEEKYIKELSTVSKVVPFINKWVYFNNGKNVRDKGYRLNCNFAFGQYNFAPSTYYTDRDVDAFSHEWYYILGIPPYFTDEENDYECYEHLHHYVKEIGEDIIEDLSDINDNYFMKYFITDKVYKDNNSSVMFTPNIKYSEFFNGNEENFAHTFFRGVKIIIKELSETLENSGETINPNNLAYKLNSKYNGYKFSCILAKYNEDGIFVIKNEKWKTITIVCAINYDMPEDAWCKNFDRTSLYALKSEYDKNGILNDGDDIEELIVDKEIEDRIVYLTTNESGYAVVRGSQLGSNMSISVAGTYNSIGFEHDNHKYLIEFQGDSYIEIDEATQTSYLYNFKLKDITNTPKYVFSDFEYVDSVLTLYKGYKDYYKNKFSNIGFKEVYESINSFNKNKVKYLTIKEDGTKTYDTDFMIELVQQKNILKSKYITSIVDENKPSSFNFNETIGYALSIDNVSIIPIARHDGYYEPAFVNCLYFADIFAKDEEMEDINVLNLCRYNNSEFNVKNEEFGIVKNMFYHKVNEENAGGILEFSNDSAFNSVYPLINEIGTSKKDFYVFNSNWDPDYFVKNLDKMLFDLQPGTKSMVEKKSFFGSKYMKIPQYVNIETFVPCDEFDLHYLEQQNYEYINGHYMHNETQNTVEFYVFLKKRLIEYFSNAIADYFKKYIKPEYSYNNIESIEDDIKSYIENNILKLYKREAVYFFTKSTRENIPYVFDTTKLDNISKLQADLTVNNIVSIKDLNNNPFDFSIVFNKNNGYSEYFGISVLLTKK